MTKRLFDMDAFEFVINYPKYLKEIEMVIKPELFPILEELKNTDPHDLVSPDVWFVSETQARGYVWSLFLNKRKGK
ncbi:MAG: hypothetical protein PHR83_01995 [Paludibacter sp.]|nr:hypothetical protein [Paludibacter sp.]